MSDEEISPTDVRAIHPDYPTPIPQLNELYREHAAQVRAYFRGEGPPPGTESTKPFVQVNCAHGGGPLEADETFGCMTCSLQVSVSHWEYPKSNPEPQE